MIGEEAVAEGRIPEVAGAPFWLVDPLDGTKEFLSGNGEFTVNIALVESGRPILGIVTAPARGLAWWGALGQGTVRRENGGAHAVTVRPRPQPALSRSPPARIATPRPIAGSPSVPSPTPCRPEAP